MDALEKKKLLIYAHYYIPDVASTAQLICDAAEGLSTQFDVTVICVVPSYEGVIADNYKTKPFYKELINGVKLLRVRVPEFSKSNKKSRIINIASYYLNSRKATRLLRNERFEYVLSISQPPIIGGMLGVYGKRKLRSLDDKHPKFIYDIQDFNPEQIMAVGYFQNKLILNVAMWLDKKNCRKSDLVISVGRDLVETLKKRFTGETVPKHIMINNWINDKEVYPLGADDSGVVEFKKKYGLEDKFIIMYSGNIGLYYDLEGLIKVIEKFKNSKAANGQEVVFAFVGAGSVLGKLVMYKEEHKLDNVVFIPYQDKDKLIYSLNAADVHWCVNAKGIKGVSCPSKFYGIAAAGKPVLAVLEESSEVEMIIKEVGCGLIAEPGDYTKVEENIKWFINAADNDEISKMGKRGYEYLVKHLTKEVSVRKYIEAIKEL